MWDRQTQSWWQQLTGEAIAGELAGAQLRFVPAQIVSWRVFAEEHPDGLTLDRPGGGPSLRDEPVLLLRQPGLVSVPVRR